MKQKILPIIGIALLVSPAMARETVVNGKLGVGLDFWERTYDKEDSLASEGTLTDADEGDKQQYGIWPEVSIISEGIKDSYSLRYAPVFKYDDVTSDNEVDHYLDLSGERFISRHWSVMLDNNFQQTDDPSSSTGDTESQEVSTSEELTRDQGRQRYWINDLRLQTDYTFGEENSVGGGYGFKVLRNDSDDSSYREYDRHNIFATFAYRYSQAIRSSILLDYVKGLYDDTIDAETEKPVSEDLDEYRATLRFDYLHGPADSFPFVYNFVGVKYDNELQRDSYAHELTVGWEQDFDSRTHLTIGGGPTYVNGEGVKGEWDYNVYLDFTRDFAHSSFNLFMEKKYDTSNFSGSSTDAGFKDTYKAKALYNHQLTQGLSGDVFAIYRWESNLDPQGDTLTEAVASANATSEESIGDITYDKNIYEIGVGLNYDFLRYYNAKLRYSYYMSDGELDSDQYNDHRILFTLSASADLWRW
ncbi:hypothetical protein [Desulfogranum marinum]|uniref:hypothetical protein n=1 Tax=Desulfogranum marinum TaxID=453220 RepID=UPI0029C60546|nr:hypothetical protein [Desulfogranum marinum]